MVILKRKFTKNGPIDLNEYIFAVGPPIAKLLFIFIIGGYFCRIKCKYDMCYSNHVKIEWTSFGVSGMSHGNLNSFYQKWQQLANKYLGNLSEAQNQSDITYWYNKLHLYLFDEYSWQMFAYLNGLINKRKWNSTDWKDHSFSKECINNVTIRTKQKTKYSQLNLHKIIEFIQIQRHKACANKRERWTRKRELSRVEKGEEEQKTKTQTIFE